MREFSCKIIVIVLLISLRLTISAQGKPVNKDTAKASKLLLLEKQDLYALAEQKAKQKLKKYILAIVNRGKGSKDLETSKRELLIKSHIENTKKLSDEKVLVLCTVTDDAQKYVFKYVIDVASIDLAKKLLQFDSQAGHGQLDSEVWWGPLTLPEIKLVEK